MSHGLVRALRRWPRVAPPSPCQHGRLMNAWLHERLMNALLMYDVLGVGGGGRRWLRRAGWYWYGMQIVHDM